MKVADLVGHFGQPLGPAGAPSNGFGARQISQPEGIVLKNNHNECGEAKQKTQTLVLFGT